MEIECVPQECPPFPESPLQSALELTAQDYRDRYKMSPGLPSPEEIKADLDDAEPWYTWFIQPGGVPRTKCKEHGVMGWAMKIDRRYPDTTSKHTLRGVAHQVFFRGRMVQVWECKPCEKWVVK